MRSHRAPFQRSELWRAGLTAMHALTDVHETYGHGARATTSFSPSIPVAMQPPADGHDTRSISDDATGAGTIDQLIPFQLSTRGALSPPTLPIARHAFGELHDTSVKAASAGEGVGIALQLPPVRRSIAATGPVMNGPSSPAAKHVPFDGHDTLSRSDGATCWFDHLLPSQRCITHHTPLVGSSSTAVHPLGDEHDNASGWTATSLAWLAATSASEGLGPEPQAAVAPVKNVSTAHNTARHAKPRDAKRRVRAPDS